MFSGSGKSWFEGMSERLTELAEETRDTPDDPNRYAAEMILLARKSQGVRNGLCRAALDGRLSEEEMRAVCLYLEEELKRLTEFADKRLPPQTEEANGRDGDKNESGGSIKRKER